MPRVSQFSSSLSLSCLISTLFALHGQRSEKEHSNIVLENAHWFPRHLSELDFIANRTLVAGVDLMSEDHPGFHDVEYRRRRDDLSTKAQQYRWNQSIPRVEYTAEETATWQIVWDKMESLWEEYACREFLHALQLMKEHCGYRRDQIPQQDDISKFLQRRTNFRMRPVAGLLSSRDFLNG